MSIILNKTSISFSGASGSKTETVNATGEIRFNTSIAPTIYYPGGVSWINSVWYADSSTLMILVTGTNTGATAKEATITVTGTDGSSAYITAKQRTQGSAALVISPSSQAVSSDSQTIQLTATSGSFDTNYIPTIVSGTAITSAVVNNSTSATVYVGANTGVARDGVIKFAGTDGSYTIFSVHQSAYSVSISVNPTSGSFSKNGETKTVSITTNYSGVITATVDSSASSWLSVSLSSDYKTATITATSGSSSRSGVITFSGGGVSATYTATQSSSDYYINLSPSTASISYVGGTVSTTIDTNYPSELTVSSNYNFASGVIQGNTLIVTVSSSMQILPRTATITVSGGSLSSSFVVTQGRASIIEISPIAQSFAANGSTSCPVTITTQYWDGEVTYSRSAEWINVSTITSVSSGSYTTNITCSANNDTNQRTGTVTFYAGTIHTTFDVTQVGSTEINPSVTINPVSSTIGANGGTKTLTAVLNNLPLGTLTYTNNNPEMITNITSSGGSYTLTIAANSGNSRTGTVVFFALGYPQYSATYTITQEGSTIIKLSVSSTVAGSTDASINFTAETNIGWTIQEISTSYVNSFSPSSGSSGITNGTIYFKNNNTTSPRTIQIKLVETGGSNNSNIISIVQSPVSSTYYIPVWKDTYCILSGTESEFSIRDKSNNTIFRGRAYSKPGEINCSVNVSDIFKNLLDSSFSFTSGISNNYEDEEFGIYLNSGGTEYLVETYKVHNDWTYDDSINYSTNQVLSDPINGHFDYRQFIPLTTYNPEGSRSYYLKINNVSTSIVYSGSSATSTYSINGSSTNTTSIKLYDGSTEKVSYGTPICGKRFALIYRNRKGGWDSFLIEGGNKKSDNMTNDSYTLTFNNTTSQFGNKTFHKEIIRTWKLVTGWLNDEESDKFSFNLIPSPVVYLQDMEKGKFIPVNITNTTSEYKTYMNNDRKLINYEINLEESQPKNFL